MTADFYVAVLLPDNATLVAFGPGAVPVFGSFGSLAALPLVAAGVSLAAPFSQSLPDFLQRLWTGAEPVGLYRVFFAAVQAGALGDGVLGAGELLALSTVDFLFTAPFTPTLEPGQAASALIAPAGGTVTATGTSGATYTLTVPPGALATATTLTLTPITALANLPLSGLLAAVRAEPEGLEFLVPVTLTITVPGGLPAQGLVGFTARGDGAQFQLVPVQTTGTTLSFAIRHFTIFGAGLFDPPDSIELTGASLSPRAAEFQAAFVAGAGSTQLAAILQAWFDEDVRSRLVQGLGADSALLAGLTEFTRWNDAVALGFPSLLGPSLPPALSQRQTEGQDLAALGFRQAIGRANTSCGSQRSLAFANAVLALQAFAQNYFPPGFNLATALLDRATVLEFLCVRIRVSTTFPPPPYPPAQPLTLQVTAQIEFTAAGAAPLLTPLEIEVRGSGVTQANSSGLVAARGPMNSPGPGMFSTTVTPDGAGPVALQITVFFGDAAAYPILANFGRIVLVGQLDVSPSSVTLAPGQTQQFTATLNGQPHAVTWSVAGAVATITPGGLFEAFTPPSTVTVVVTATSTTNPNLTGTATVTVQGTGSASAVCGPLTVSNVNSEGHIAIIYGGAGGACTLQHVPNAGGGGSSGSPDEILLIDADNRPVSSFELSGPNNGANWGPGPAVAGQPAGTYTFTRQRIAAPNAGTNFRLRFTVTFSGADLTVSNVEISPL